MKAWADKHWLVVIFLSTVSCPLPGQRAPSDLPRVTLPDAPALIYSTRADDPWNRIFFFLFSRRLDVRLSADFPQGAPFDRRGDIPMSQDVFERNETGDHAIDPMYPTFSVGFGSNAGLARSGIRETYRCSEICPRRGLSPTSSGASHDAE